MVPTKRRGKWTDETRKLAGELMLSGMSDIEIGKRVDMSQYAVWKFLVSRRPPRCKRGADKVRRNLIQLESAPKVRPDMIDRRDQYLDARSARDHSDLMRGDCTAAFFGDPPPGFSALDRKRAGA